MLKYKKTYFIPIIGFALIILIGSILLYSPMCNIGNLSYKNCLFIATSGLTTTGIVKGPLITQFNFTGQLILALLMEIGAMGFIIFVSYFWSMKNKKMKMSDIMVINDSINGDDYSNITKHSILFVNIRLVYKDYGLYYYFLNLFLYLDFERKYGLVFSILYLHLVIQDLIFWVKKYVNVCPRFICSNYNDFNYGVRKLRDYCN